MRHTRAHTANRRSHHALKSLALTTDSKTGATHIRHRATKDGMYKGKSVKDPVKKLQKKQKKAKK
ncbi:MAG TPA: 50S ribosomal protein L32 [Candidatus Paceibacterota bacterium]|nr:50S ribosomal protein L32 [Candidatus Paceibacterota bacterium]